jgi:hypothetical protein
MQVGLNQGKILYHTIEDTLHPGNREHYILLSTDLDLTGKK